MLGKPIDLSCRGARSRPSVWRVTWSDHPANEEESVNDFTSRADIRRRGVRRRRYGRVLDGRHRGTCFERRIRRHRQVACMRQAAPGSSRPRRQDDAQRDQSLHPRVRDRRSERPRQVPGVRHRPGQCDRRLSRLLGRLRARRLLRTRADRGQRARRLDLVEPVRNQGTRPGWRRLRQLLKGFRRHPGQDRQPEEDHRHRPVAVRPDRRAEQGLRGGAAGRRRRSQMPVPGQARADHQPVRQRLRLRSGHPRRAGPTRT